MTRQADVHEQLPYEKFLAEGQVPKTSRASSSSRLRPVLAVYVQFRPSGRVIVAGVSLLLRDFKLFRVLVQRCHELARLATGTRAIGLWQEACKPDQPAHWQRLPRQLRLGEGLTRLGLGVGHPPPATMGKGFNLSQRLQLFLAWGIHRPARAPAFLLCNALALLLMKSQDMSDHGAMVPRSRGAYGTMVQCYLGIISP